MNNEENAKQVWQTPEIVDLDVANTASGLFPSTPENHYASVSPS